MIWVTEQPSALIIGIIALVVLLISGSLAAHILSKRPGDKWQDLGPRMRSWWTICGLLVPLLVIGWQTFILLWAFLSYIALREFLTLAPTRREDRLVVLFAYLSIVFVYWAIWIDNYDYFLTFTPVYMFLGMAVMMAFLGRVEGFLATVGIIHWGIILCVFNLGHVALLMRTPEIEVAAYAGPAGLVFFLILITQLNDVTQYIWGKMLGKHKISPTISPNKTWEGAIGGFATTTIIFVILAPYFTPLLFWQSIIVGAFLPVLGFFGDVTMSAIKRDLGVKDSSRLIPGHGGALDRLDSLMFTAPWYFHSLAFFSLERF